MKKSNLLKLTKLNKESMSNMKGGHNGCVGQHPCCCACAYANSGGSSTGDNAGANHSGGLQSVGCDCW